MIWSLYTLYLCRSSISGLELDGASGEGRCDVCVPFLQDDLCGICAGLGSDEFLEVADCVVRAAFHSNLRERSESRPNVVERSWHNVPLRPRRSLAITCDDDNMRSVGTKTTRHKIVSCETDFNQRHGKTEIERVKG